MSRSCLRPGLLVAALLVAACDLGSVASGGAAPDAGAEADGGGGGNPHVAITGPQVLPHVQAFADAACAATGACTVSTYVGHDPSADRAIDTLVSDAFGQVPSDGNALGEAHAQFALDHFKEYGVMYVIFRQRINLGAGWQPMEDRGSITQNHYDHVHVSFETTAPTP